MLRNNGIDSDRRRFGFRAFIWCMEGDKGANAQNANEKKGENTRTDRIERVNLERRQLKQKRNEKRKSATRAMRN